MGETLAFSQSVRGRVEELFKPMTDVITWLCGEQTGGGVDKLEVSRNRNLLVFTHLISICYIYIYIYVPIYIIYPYNISPLTREWLELCPWQLKWRTAEM